VGVGDHVVPELVATLQDVVDDGPQEGDVAAGPDGDEDVGQGAGAAEARVDVDDGRALELGLHHPLEPDRMALGHVRSHDQDAVRVGQVLLEGGCASPTEGCPQTGDGGGVSYAGLVLDLDGAQGGGQLLDEVVLLVVEGGPAQAADAHGAAHVTALVVGVLPRFPAGGDDPVGDHVH